MAENKQIAFDFDNLPAADISETKAVTPVAEKAAVIMQDTSIAINENIVDLTELETVQQIPKKQHNKKATRGRMSLKDSESGADLIEVPDDEVLFEKMYYPIGTVATMFKVNQSLIRFWENEFDILKPKKNGKGDRLFRPEDVKNLKLIYHLLRERKYTLEGAKDFLKNNKKANEKFAMIESLKKLKGFLNELKANL